METENQTTFFKEKYITLYQKINHIPFSSESHYQKLYEELYQETYKKIFNYIKNNEFDINSLIFYLNILESISYEDIHQLLIYSMSYDRKTFVEYIFNKYTIDYNYVNPKNNKHIINSVLQNKYKDIFDIMIASNKIDYQKYGFNILNSAIYQITDVEPYYLYKLLEMDEISEIIKSMDIDNYKKIIESLKPISKSIYKIEVYKKVISHPYFRLSEELIYALIFLNKDDDLKEIIIDILNGIYNVNKIKEATFEFEINSNFIGMIILSSISFNHDCINTIFDLIKLCNEELRKKVFSDEYIIETIYKIKSSFKKKYKTSSNEEIKMSYLEKYTKITEFIHMIYPEKDKEDEIIICKNQHTCNICLDESSTNRIYKKCDQCNHIFHSNCLEDYHQSCDNENKCCYCQKFVNFFFVKE